MADKVTKEQKAVRKAMKFVRRDLLNTFRAERVRHWKMRGSHRLGQHFERGFFRGLNHACAIVDSVTKIVINKPDILEP